MPGPHQASTELIRGRWPFMLTLFFAMLPLGAGPEGATEGSGLRQVVLVMLFLAATFAVVRFPARLHLLRAGVPVTLTALLLYLLISVGWSPDPWVSFKRVVQVIGVTMLAAAVLVGGNGRQRLHNIMPPVLWAGMALAIITTVVAPTYAFSDFGYRAFMATKNNFGQLAVLCTMIPLALLGLEPKARRWVWLPLVLLGVVGLVLSRSATSVVALLAVAALYSVALGLRRLHKSWWPVLLVPGILMLVAVFGYLVVQGLPAFDTLLAGLLAPAGRDITLSGRTYLWELIAHEGMRHPWFGTGYGGFWLGLEGQSGQVAYQVKWGYPGQAHNGYLDLFNELGVVGCTLVLAFVVQHSRNIIRLLGVNRQLGLFHAALLLLVMVMNLAEATFLRTTHIWWMVFVVSVLEVAYLCRGGDTHAVRPLKLI